MLIIQNKFVNFWNQLVREEKKQIILLYLEKSGIILKFFYM